MTINENELSIKAAEILCVLSKPKVDVWELRQLALTDGGLVNDEIRKRAWPLLVGVRGFKGSEDEVKSSRISAESAVRDSVFVADDFFIIERDVVRSWHLLDRRERELRNSSSEHERDQRLNSSIRLKQRGLVDLINATLLQGNDILYYYQGFHELASVFLTTLCEFDEAAASTHESNQAGEIDLSLSIAVLSKVSRSHLIDLLKGDFSHLETVLQVSLFPLLAKVDPEIHEHLSDCCMQPSFAVSWIITWFSRDIRDSNLVKRLFDFFLVSHPLMPVYVAVGMITHKHNRAAVLKSDCEYSSVYGVLLELPKNSSSVPSCDDSFTESERSTDFCSGFNVDVARVIDEDTGSQLHDDTEDSTACADSEPVSFEDILHLALDYIRQIPPRRLLSLASAYYGTAESRKLKKQVHKISMLTSPSWAAPPFDPMWKREDDSLPAIALGFGLHSAKRLARLTRRKCLSLSALACLVFFYTLRYAWSTHMPSQFDFRRMHDSEQNMNLIQLPTLSNVPHMNLISDAKGLLNSATRLVIDNVMSVHSRTGGSIAFVSEGDIPDNLAEPALSSDNVSENRRLVNPCLSNETTAANVLLSRGLPVSTAYCLMAWFISEQSSGR